MRRSANGKRDDFRCSVHCCRRPASSAAIRHQAFFSGFLPTPATPGQHPRLFALAFEGSETITDYTYVFPHSANIVDGLRRCGYATICIGGVGFFNLRNPLGRVLPELFEEHYWQPGFAVRTADSTEQQVALAIARLHACSRRVFLFINISDLYQPNRHYLPGHASDDFDSHCAALR